LFTKNSKIERSFRKLNYKWIDFYKIKKIMTDVCQLNLSQSMKIYDTFHISLLRKVVIDFLIEQIQSSSSSIVIEKKKEYEINNILNSRYHYEKLQYKVEWIDHSSNKAWYFAKIFQKHSKEILNDYHQRYLNKSKSKLRLIALITSMTNHFYWLQQTKNLVKDILNKMKAKMKKNDRMRSKENSFINTFDRH
jgi:predicted metal-dependent hydrolase